MLTMHIYCTAHYEAHENHDVWSV